MCCLFRPFSDSLSLASPRKSKQKEGDPQVGAGCAGPLRYSALAGAAELGATPLKQSSPFFPLRLALLDDAKGKMKTSRTSTANRFDSVRCAFPPPRGAPSNGVRPGAVGEDCLRAKPEFRSHPAARVAQGSRRSRPRNAGGAFSLASFFWRPKRKNARASGAENSLSLLHHTYRSQSPSHARSNPQPADCLPACHDAACRLVENKGNPYA